VSDLDAQHELTDSHLKADEENRKAAHISRKTVAERIKSLKEKGIIKRIGNNKTGHWDICN